VVKVTNNFKVSPEPFRATLMDICSVAVIVGINESLGYTWKPGYILFRVDGQWFSPNDSTLGNRGVAENVMVRELEEGESFTITK
jgi:hypothetical protein